MSDEQDEREAKSRKVQAFACGKCERVHKAEAEADACCTCEKCHRKFDRLLTGYNPLCPRCRWGNNLRDARSALRRAQQEVIDGGRLVCELLDARPPRARAPAEPKRRLKAVP